MENCIFREILEKPAEYLISWSIIREKEYSDMASNPPTDPSNIIKETIRTLVSILEQKDPYFSGHSERIASSCILFARSLSMPKELMDALYLASLLYDIGMVYIPNEIINKPGPLTAGEMALVKEHPKIAERILSHLSYLKSTLTIIRHHHETYDGSGYPDGLSGDAIPVGARILSIVDSYDAMTSSRPHRDALTNAEALEEIRKNAGSLFDPKIVEMFIRFASEKANLQKKDKGNIADAVREVVDSFKRGYIDLPVFPGIIGQIRQTVSSANTTIDDLADVIEQDPVITLRLITAANSVHYGGGGKIQTVRQAVARIGIRDTQDFVSAIAMKSVYASNNPDVKTVMEKFWQHAIATAYMARAIALRLRERESDTIFLLGLTHDIGKVLLLHSLIKILYRKEKDPIINMEEILASVQAVHTSFGGALLQRWGFSESIVKAVSSHESPKLTSETPRMLLILYLANILTRRIGYSLFTDEPPDIGHVILLLDLETSQVVDILQDVKKAAQKAIGSA